MGRAHHAPCAQHFVAGDDSRRRATPSTLVASLLRREEIAPICAFSASLLIDCADQFFTMLSSILQHSRPISMGLDIPAIEDCCRVRSRHGSGLVEHELPVRVIRMLWVLLDGTLTSYRARGNPSQINSWKPENRIRIMELIEKWVRF